MDWSLVSFYQGTDNNSDPSMAVIQVMYLSQAICFETAFDVPIELAQESDDFNSLAESIAQLVLVSCPATIANPDYDSSLTSCWV